MHKKLYIKTIGQGEPLVMLHGWGWHSGIWEPIIPALSARYQLILIDLPGCGKSPLLTPHYAIEKIAGVLLENVPEQAHWLGWSLGGMLAWWIAVHFPERVKRLVTVASSPRFISDINWPGTSLTALKKFADALEENQEKTLQNFLKLQLRNSFLNQSQIHFLSSEKTALLGGLDLLYKIDLRASLNQVTCPSLHIFGSMDTLVPVKIANLLPPFLPKGRCEIIKRTGHIPFLSQPETFNHLLADFL